MPLPFWGSGKPGDVADLIARRKYAKAIEVLREQLRIETRDSHVRKQLADLLILSGRAREAVPVMIDLADDYAAQGYAAKSIALLKKIEKIDPGREDVDVKLAGLINGSTRTRPAWQAGARVDSTGYEPSGQSFSEDQFKEAAPEYTDADRIAAARGASWVPETRRDEALPPEMAGMAPRPPEDDAVEVTPDVIVEEGEGGLSPDLFRGAMLDAIQSAMRPAPEPPARGSGAQEGIVESPLFSGFAQDELVAVMRGLRLLTFEPGDIILTQGDEGRSVFVLATGTAKAFVKEPSGRRQVMVRTMDEGEFFGEISILSGKPRTATVTAATHCELLELDRETLDKITETYPRVRQVLEEFYIQRASTQEDLIKHAVRSPGRSALPDDPPKS